MKAIDLLIADVERLGDETAREKARELVGAVLAFHREGLERVLTIAHERGDAGLTAALAKDPAAASVLALHDLLPDASLVPAEGLVRRREAHAACEVCGAPIAERHDHLVDAKRRGVDCACAACAVLFPARRIRPRVERVELSDAAWDALGLPIGLAFFVRSSETERVVALYPSPAGPTESVLRIDAALPDFAPDVEALLVNRMEGVRHSFLVSVDRAYELVGILRKEWRGFTGGADARRAIDGFFRELEARC